MLTCPWRTGWHRHTRPAEALCVWVQLELQVCTIRHSKWPPEGITVAGLYRKQKAQAHRHRVGGCFRPVEGLRGSICLPFWICSFFMQTKLLICSGAGGVIRLEQVLYLEAEDSRVDWVWLGRVVLAQICTQVSTRERFSMSLENTSKAKLKLVFAGRTSLAC